MFYLCRKGKVKSEISAGEFLRRDRVTMRGGFIEELSISSEDRKKIYRDNARKLLRLNLA